MEFNINCNHRRRIKLYLDKFTIFCKKRSQEYNFKTKERKIKEKNNFDNVKKNSFSLLIYLMNLELSL